MDLPERVHAVDQGAYLGPGIRRPVVRVFWDAWENTSDMTAVPSEFRFATAQYEAELARAAADHSWEEPLDTTARLLRQSLADSGWFERWGCVLTEVWPRREEPDLPEVIRSSPGVDVVFQQSRGPGEPADVYAYELIVTGDHSVEEQVRRFADRILADDPRKTAEIRGC